jgi:transketolase
LNTPETLHHLLPSGQTTIAIEAGSSMGMAGLVGRDGYVLGLDRFGESAPYETLKEHFGYTPQALVERILATLGLRQQKC